MYKDFTSALPYDYLGTLIRLPWHCHRITWVQTKDFLAPIEDGFLADEMPFYHARKSEADWTGRLPQSVIVIPDFDFGQKKPFSLAFENVLWYHGESFLGHGALKSNGTAAYEIKPKNRS